MLVNARGGVGSCGGAVAVGGGVAVDLCYVKSCLVICSALEDTRYINQTLSYLNEVFKNTKS